MPESDTTLLLCCKLHSHVLIAIKLGLHYSPTDCRASHNITLYVPDFYGKHIYKVAHITQGKKQLV